MEIPYKVITTSDALRDAVAELAKYPVIGFDTETTELDPYKGRVRLVQLSTPEGFTYIFDLDRFASGDMRKVESLEPLRRLLAAQRPVKIAHNAKFDAKWIRHYLGAEIGGEYDSWTCSQIEVERGGLFDTLLASQIVSAGDTEDRHGLQLVVERYLDQAMDKSSQLSDWSGELSETRDSASFA
jgi:ribonuclease D